MSKPTLHPGLLGSGYLSGTHPHSSEAYTAGNLRTAGTNHPGHVVHQRCENAPAKVNKRYSGKQEHDLQQNTFQRSHLRYHKRNKSEPVTNCLKNTLKLKLNDRAYLQTETSETSTPLDNHSQQIPVGLSKQINQHQGLNKPKDESQLNFFNQSRRSSVQNYYDPEVDKENTHGNCNIDFRFERQALAQKRPPTGFKSGQALMALSKQEKPRETLSSHIDEFPRTHGANDTPCFSNSRFHNAQEHSTQHHRSSNLQDVIPVNEENTPDHPDTSLGNTRVSPNTRYYRQESPPLLNISEIHPPDKSSNKITPNGSVCLFDDNASFQNFLNNGNCNTTASNNKTHSATNYYIGNVASDLPPVNSFLSTIGSNNTLLLNSEDPIRNPSKQLSTIRQPTHRISNSETALSYLPSHSGQSVYSQAEALKYHPRETSNNLTGRHSQDMMYSQSKQSSRPQSKSSLRRSFHSRNKSMTRMHHIKRKVFAEDLPGSYLLAQQRTQPRPNKRAQYYKLRHDSRHSSDQEACIDHPAEPIAKTSSTVGYHYTGNTNTLTNKGSNNCNLGTTETSKLTHNRSRSYPEKPLEDRRPQLSINTDQANKSDISSSNIFSNSKVSQYTSNILAHRRQSYKDSVRPRDRKSYEHTQICKNSLSRVASQPESLCCFNESLLNERSTELCNDSKVAHGGVEVSTLQDLAAYDPYLTKDLAAKEDSINQKTNKERKVEPQTYSYGNDSQQAGANKPIAHYKQERGASIAAELLIGESIQSLGANYIEPRKAVVGGYQIASGWGVRKSREENKGVSSNTETQTEDLQDASIMRDITGMAHNSAAQRNRQRLPSTKVQQELDNKQQLKALDDVTNPKDRSWLLNTKQKAVKAQAPSVDNSNYNIGSENYYWSASRDISVDKVNESISSERAECTGEMYAINDLSRHLQRSQIPYYDVDSNVGLESKHRLITDPVENYPDNAQDAYISELEKDYINMNPATDSGAEERSSIAERYGNTEPAQIGGTNPSSKFPRMTESPDQLEAHENYFQYESSPQLNEETQPKDTTLKESVVKIDYEAHSDAERTNELFSVANHECSRPEQTSSLPFCKPLMQKERSKSYGRRLEFDSLGPDSSEQNHQRAHNILPSDPEYQSFYSPSSGNKQTPTVFQHQTLFPQSEAIEDNNLGKVPASQVVDPDPSLRESKEDRTGCAIQARKAAEQRSNKDAAMLKIEINSQIQKLMQEKLLQQREQEASRMKMKQSILSQLHEWEQKKDAEKVPPHPVEKQGTLHMNTLKPHQYNQPLESPSQVELSSDHSSEQKYTKQSFGLYSSPEPMFIGHKPQFQNHDSEALADVDHYRSNEGASSSQRSDQKQQLYHSPDHFVAVKVVNSPKVREASAHPFNAVRDEAVPQYHEENSRSSRRTDTDPGSNYSRGATDVSQAHWISGDVYAASPSSQINVSRQSEVSRSRSNLDEIHEVDSHESSPNMFSNLNDGVENGLSAQASSNSERLAHNQDTNRRDFTKNKTLSLTHSTRTCASQDNISIKTSQEELPESFTCPNSFSYQAHRLGQSKLSLQEQVNQHLCRSNQDDSSGRYTSNDDTCKHSYLTTSQQLLPLNSNGSNTTHSYEEEEQVITEVEDRSFEQDNTLKRSLRDCSSPNCQQVGMPSWTRHNYPDLSSKVSVESLTRDDDIESMYSPKQGSLIMSYREKDRKQGEHESHYYMGHGHACIERDNGSGSFREQRRESIGTESSTVVQEKNEEMADISVPVQLLECRSQRSNKPGKEFESREMPESMGVSSRASFSSRQLALNKPPLNPNQKNLIAFKPSNKQLIRNAMTNVFLPGELNKKDREAVFQRMSEVRADNYVILFTDMAGQKDFKGLYSYDATTGDVRCVCAVTSLPRALESRMIAAYYRYDSCIKDFKIIPGNKAFSIAVDAVMLHADAM